jgi:hypothetical protein
MRLKNENQEKVIITIKSRTDNKSKSLTVYETTVDDMVKAITKMIKANAT